MKKFFRNYCSRRYLEANATEAKDFLDILMDFCSNHVDGDGESTKFTQDIKALLADIFIAGTELITNKWGMGRDPSI